MSKQKSQIGVILNYLALILFLILFQVGKSIGWNIKIVVGEIAILLLIIFVFIKLYYKNNLWNLVHSSYEKLNEKEADIINISLRNSYKLFSIISLVILFLYALVEKKIGMELVVGLIYFAHTLPASIIAWNDWEVKGINSNLKV